jgi:hypothetical protein
MTTAYTSLLGLALPVTGELSGTWGDTVNNSITSLLDSAIAGTTTLSTDADVTLTTTTGAANTSREAILLWTAGGTATRTITAPAQSKIYTVINASSSTQSIKLVGVGPTAGVTIIKGESALCAWNGSDFIKISNTAGSGVFTSITNSGLTSGRVVYSTTGGLETDSANLLYSGTDLTVYGITVGRGAGAVATNTAVGASALAANSSGTQNVSVGTNSLLSNTSASFNTSVGVNNLYSNTTGASNTALGNSALFSNTTASNNTAVGYQAGYSNTTGAAINAFGYQALYANTTGVGNSAFGGYHAGNYDAALKANTTGNNNNAFGSGALSANTTGSNNTSVGYASLASNTTASQNTAVGYQSLYANTTTTGHVAVGYVALSSNTTGSYNTAVGRASASSNTTGDSNTAVGYTALGSNTTGSSNTAVGFQSLQSNTTASNNTAVGYTALYTNTAFANTAVGHSALYSNTSAIGNNAFGYFTLYANSTGAQNCAFGGEAYGAVDAAMRNNTTGSYNVAMGVGALKSNTTASYNTAVGYQAGYSNITGAGNVYFGRGAGLNATSNNLTFVGQNAGYNSTGSDNTFIGQSSGFSMTTGSKNTILGGYNGNQGSLDIRTSSNYIVLSDGDGNPRGIFDNNGNLLVGTTSTAANPTGFSAVQYSGGTYTRIAHNTSAGASDGYIQFFYNSTQIGSITQNGTTGVLYNLTSDYRLKNNSEALTGAKDFVMALQPKKWQWWDGSGEGVGFIAHEFMAVAKYSGHGEKDAVDAEGKPVMQSIQPSSSEVMANLVAHIQNLETRLAALEAK